MNGIMTGPLTGREKTRPLPTMSMEWAVRLSRHDRLKILKTAIQQAAASEEVWCTLRGVEPLSDAKTPLVDCFSILLSDVGSSTRALLVYVFT